MFNLFRRKQNGNPPANTAPAAASDDAQPRKPYAVAFIDYEHWYISLERMYHTKPDIRKWRTSLAEKFDVGDIIFFGDFSNPSLRADIPRIREITSYIIETQNASAHFEKDFTDFIMLDHIYQKAVTDEAIDVFIIFSGDGHFSSVASFITNRVGKQVGVYAVKGALSTQLRNSANWAEEVSPTPAATAIRTEHVTATRRTAESKHAEAKKAEADKAESKAEEKAEKAEKKKAAAKPEAKKSEAKAEDKKAEEKASKDKKAEDKKAADKKSEAAADDKKSESKKAEGKSDEKKSESKKAEGRSEDKKSAEKKTETKKAEVRKADAKAAAETESGSDEKTEAPAARIRVKVTAAEKLKPSGSAADAKETAPKDAEPKAEEKPAAKTVKASETAEPPVSADKQEKQSAAPGEDTAEPAPLPADGDEADEGEKDAPAKRHRRRRRSRSRSSADQTAPDGEAAEAADADEDKEDAAESAPSRQPEQTQEALPDEPIPDTGDKTAPRADITVSLTVGSQMILKNLDYIDNQNRQRDEENRQAALPTFWGTVEVVSRLNHVERKCILDSMHYLLSKGYVYQESVQIDDKDVKTLRVDWEKAYGLYQRS